MKVSCSLLWVITFVHSQGTEDGYLQSARLLFIQSYTPTHEVVPPTVGMTFAPQLPYFRKPLTDISR